MVLFLDTNILIDYYTRRPPFFSDARHVMELCLSDGNCGCVAFHSLPNIFYILRKGVSREERISILKHICDIFTITAASQVAVRALLDDSAFDDLEDALQYACADEIMADVIVTRDTTGFAGSSIRVCTPAELIADLER